MRCDRTAILIVHAAWCTAVAADQPASNDKPLPTIAAKVAQTEVLSGLLDCYIDHRAAKLYCRIPAQASAGLELLYVSGLAGGLGSNPLGLDRGISGPTRFLVLRLVGERLLIEQPNLRFRARSNSPVEVNAVRESFAPAVLWAGKAVARDPDGAVLVDLTPFILRDSLNIAERLQRAGEGQAKLDEQRSVLLAQRCLVFPDNCEFEGRVTFAIQKPGREIRDTAADARAVTLAVHHSFIRPPDAEYRPRRADPRTGSFALSFRDYATPLHEPIEQRYVYRHRLQKRVPDAARSAVLEPLVYYVDSGIPEPLRSAVVEGASWWAAAFASAGFEDAYRVELLPEDAHPLDVRYNVIEWVHRATRGWSYGGMVADPRTGEIIKGHVRLGSLRVRQDRLLFEGILGTQYTASGHPHDPVQLSLARIRQLAAHEVGHTLGFAHNFAASTYGRASVMDYPAPWIRVTADGREFDLSAVYATGVGVWDHFAVRYAYTQCATGVDERAALAALAAEPHQMSWWYLSDADARSAGAAHPLASLWDNGSDPVAALEETLAVRQLAMERFDDQRIAEGRPLAELAEVFVPLYLHHRYQVQAAIKVIGGQYYDYAVRGADYVEPHSPSADQQNRALRAVLDCLSPEFLDIPDSALNVLTPRSPASAANRELFKTNTGLFDPLRAAEAAATEVVTALLHPRRCERLVEFHRRQSELPGLQDVVESAVQRVTQPQLAAQTRRGAIQRMTQRVVVKHLQELAANQGLSWFVRGAAEDGLQALARRLRPVADAAFVVREIERFLERPTAALEQDHAAAAVPPGSPIGRSSGDGSGLHNTLYGCGFHGP